MMFRSLVRPLFFALSLAFATSAAAPAFAGDESAKAADHSKKPEHGGKGKGKHAGKDKVQFPLAADKFTKMVDTRLTSAKERLDAGLTKHKVADADKTKALKEFDDGAALIRAAAKRVGKDGEVTKDEAKEVRTMGKSLRKQIRSKYMPKKADKAADKGVAKPVPKDI